MVANKKTLAALLSLVGASQAWEAPAYSGYTLIWQDTFSGAGGSSPNSGNWNIIQGNLGVNAELETYTASNRNVQLSGGNTLQLVPWQDGSVSGGWTSGRVESKYTFTPQAGKVTRAEGQIRFGTGTQSQEQGIWPAFWMLGDALRSGAAGWPACGEIDILEVINGLQTGYGTLHCNVFNGGICNEPSGLGAHIGISGSMNAWHTWRVEINRAQSSWQNESLQWSMDGAVYHTITGAQIGDQATWNAVAHSPLFFILNVAVGGSWPGYPNGNTLGGYGSMLEAGYVAVYSN